MAKVTFGPLVSEARNRQGDVVFSRNRFGNYTRPYILTPNPGTSPQLAAVARMTAAGDAWRNTLTDHQRAAWRAYAAVVPFSDVFNQRFFCTGYNFFARVFARLDAAGLATLTDPPTDQNASAPALFTVTLDSPAEGDVTITPASPPDAGDAPQVWSAPPQNPTAHYFFRRLRLLQTFAPGDPGPYTITAALADRFPGALPGQLLGLGLRYLRSTNAATCGIITQASTVPAGGFDMLKKATRTLTPTQVQNLLATPLDIIPAPGPGKFAYPLNWATELTFNATPYANPGTGHLALINPLPFTWDSGDLTFISAAATRADMQNVGANAGTIFTQMGSAQANTPVQITQDGVAEFTTGDSEVTVTIWYVLLDLP